MQRRVFAIAMFGVVAASGCSASDGGYKPGELGNGGFYFSCDNAVSCARYSNDAAKFPKAVSLGSTFTMRFVTTASNDSHITFDDKAPDRGITIKPAGEFISRGPNGMVAVKSGYATVTSRDAAGQLVDFVTIRVAKPEKLVVYPADDVTDTPQHVDSVTVGLGERRTYRAFAQEKGQVLAGTLQVEWKSADTRIVDIELLDGKATIVPRAAGKTNLVATGGTFAQEIPIEVKQ